MDRQTGERDAARDAVRDAGGDLPPSDARVGDDVAPDAGEDVPLHPNTGCPLRCNGGCWDGACHINGLSADPDKVYRCAPDMPCVVDCLHAGTCAGRIECGRASSCSVTCGGNGGGEICNGTIDCGETPECNVVCANTSPCAFQLLCRDSDCRIKCYHSSCSGHVDCGTGSCAFECVPYCDATYDCNEADPCTCEDEGCNPVEELP